MEDAIFGLTGAPSKSFDIKEYRDHDDLTKLIFDNDQKGYLIYASINSQNGPEEQSNILSDNGLQSDHPYTILGVVDI